jgi:exosortase O
MVKLVCLLATAIFWPGLLGLYQIYSLPWFWQNALTAILILLLFIFTARHHLSPAQLTSTPAVGLLIICFLLSLNLLFFHFQIITPILAILALYFLSGLFLTSRFWRRSLPLFLLLILTLPLLERLQKFIGFPLRLLTAKLVSFLLGLMNVGHLSQETVIIIENHATTIDLPCSGVKSFYFGAIFLFALVYLHQVKVNLKNLGLILCYFFLLFFFNFWRVFSLTIVYGYLRLITLGNSIHLLLGLIGFVLANFFLWRYFVSEKPVNDTTSLVPARPLSPATSHLVTIFLVFFLLITNLFTQPKAKNLSTPPPPVITLPHLPITPIPLSQAELSLFADPAVQTAGRFQFVWQEKNISLLLVKSLSSRRHHDPQICLQSLGYQLINEQDLNLYGQTIKQLKVSTGYAYYWFQNGQTVIADYSQRVWHGLTNPNQSWWLVEILVPSHQQLTLSELSTLFTQLSHQLL